MCVCFSVNNEDLTPLDVAVMTNHVPMAKMLLQHGARENPKCKLFFALSCYTSVTKQLNLN